MIATIRKSYLMIIHTIHTYIYQLYFGKQIIIIKNNSNNELDSPAGFKPQWVYMD